ncbi:unnamed protein product [Schistosoma curassoni]|uniref:Endonuclease/exonuclease/phosphatase domain-containing protein n=1 Tax=Schistosoma curassoni TaxID=6186 RepID=A0A183K6U2_9TREM|nr:unnamed protein product [Schistosoma curassoni]
MKQGKVVQQSSFRPDRCCYLDVVVGLAYRDEATELHWLEQPFLKVLPRQKGRLKSGTSRRTLPRCEQPGSENRPHTSNSTQDHCIHNQPPSSIPIIPPTLTSNSKLLFSAPSSSVTIANNSSAQNTVPGLLKPRSTLHIGAFNVRTVCRIGQQASLAKTLESRTIDVCCVSERRIQDPSVVIHLTSPRQNGEPTRYTLRASDDQLSWTGRSRDSTKHEGGTSTVRVDPRQQSSMCCSAKRLRKNSEG